MTDLRARAAMAANPDVQAATDEALRNPSADTIGAAIEAAVQAAPDLSSSGIEASQDVPVHVAWSRVMGEVQYVAKSDRRADAGGKYNFRGIDAVLNAVGPALRKHGVSVVQTSVAPTYERVQTGGGKTMQLCRVTVTYAVIGPKGDMLPVELVSVGEAFDAGDKSTPKAMSVALRSCYINSLAIPTNEPHLDPERGPQYEIETPPPPTAENYRAEIVKESTTLARLRAIREELERHPALANTVIEDVDGSEIRLISLVTKVGRSKAGAEQ
jgi:hypothetical protein